MNGQCSVERTVACGERVNCEAGAETCGPEVVRGQETRAQQAVVRGQETRAQQADSSLERALAPPSGRDVELFRAVKFELTSTRAAAERFGISQTRVRQIVARVAKWVSASLPAQDEVQQAEELRLARLVAAERLQAMLENLTTMWRINYEPKYQRQMQRVIAAQARLGVADGQFDELVANEVGDLPHDGPIDTWPAETPPVNPPDGDCSPVVDAHTLDTLRTISTQAANRYEEMVSGYAQALADLADLQTAKSTDLLSPLTFENVSPPLMGAVEGTGRRDACPTAPVMST